MSARYLHPKVRLEGLRVSATFELPAAETVGYHLFDESDTLIVDGPRVQATGPVEIAIDLPAEPGRYTIFVSPLREGESWNYERGWPFLLIEAVVEDGSARIESAGITTRKGLWWRRLPRALQRALTYPVLTVWRNRSLIRAMVRRDVLGRYRGSFGGVFWTILNPLLLMVTYFFVFGVVLQARFEADPSQAGFALYFLAGMLPWLAFSEAVARSATVVWEHRTFVKKLVFAVETLPVNLVISGLVSEVFALAIFTIGLFLAKGAVPTTVLWLPFLIVPQVLFTAGVCWFLAASGVFVRDLGQVIGFALTLWFFLTPICYPEASLPSWAAPVLSKNPIYTLVRGYRAVFLEAQAPALGSLAKLWLLSAAVCVAGHAWFYKLRKSFADIV